MSLSDFRIRQGMKMAIKGYAEKGTRRATLGDPYGASESFEAAQMLSEILAETNRGRFINQNFTNSNNLLNRRDNNLLGLTSGRNNNIFDEFD
jgi:hypothetical protein